VSNADGKKVMRASKKYSIFYRKFRQSKLTSKPRSSAASRRRREALSNSAGAIRAHRSSIPARWARKRRQLAMIVAADVPAEAMPVDASRPARGAQFRVFAEQDNLILILLNRNL
jgi:hypothetical protein